MRAALAVSPQIVRYRKNADGPRVLDLGCGTGERAIALARRSFNHVTGLDAARNLIDLAVQQAVRRCVEVVFVCGDPGATPFPTGSFDEVMVLGTLFGHMGSARGDVQLLREAGRLLKPRGSLHLKFPDGNWIRANYRADAVEGLPTGFIYRQRTLSGDGHVLRTDVLSSSEEFGIAHQETVSENLYAPRDVSELLHRVGFGSIAYDDVLGGKAPANTSSGAPVHLVHCKWTGRVT
jgi:SAM-dependent methyltransferase